MRGTTLRVRKDRTRASRNLTLVLAALALAPASQEATEPLFGPAGQTELREILEWPEYGEAKPSIPGVLNLKETQRLVTEARRFVDRMMALAAPDWVLPAELWVEKPVALRRTLTLTSPPSDLGRKGTATFSVVEGRIRPKSLWLSGPSAGWPGADDEREWIRFAMAVRDVAIVRRDSAELIRGTVHSDGFEWVPTWKGVRLPSRFQDRFFYGPTGDLVSWTFGVPEEEVVGLVAALERTRPWISARRAVAVAARNLTSVNYDAEGYRVSEPQLRVRDFVDEALEVGLYYRSYQYVNIALESRLRERGPVVGLWDVTLQDKWDPLRSVRVQVDTVTGELLSVEDRRHSW